MHTMERVQYHFYTLAAIAFFEPRKVRLGWVSLLILTYLNKIISLNLT